MISLDAVAAGALATAGDHDAAAREVAMVTESGGLAKEGSYLRSVLVAHLADAAVALGDAELCHSLCDDIDALTDSCGVNGVVVAFAGPFAHPAGVLAAALGDIDLGRQLFKRSVDTSRRLGAGVWIRRGETALSELDHGLRPTREHHDTDRASMTRSGGIWSVTWRDESASLPHSKGLVDLDAEIDCAIRRATGLAGRPRREANDPAERARIRDAIGRLHAISPRLAAHLDRSIRTGSRCSYMPSADGDIRWDVEIG